MIGSEDPGCKPVVSDRRSDGNGGECGHIGDTCPPCGSTATTGAARGGQHAPRRMFKAQETSNKPVVPDNGRAVEGIYESRDTAKDPTIPR